MIFTNKKQKFAEEYYDSIGSVYKNIANQMEEIEELKFLFNNEAFSSEFLFLLLFFSTKLLPNKITNPKYSKSILDEVHNLYYKNLREKLKVQDEEVSAVNILLNKRYSEYRRDFNSENTFYNISKLFLKNINYDLNNINVLITISFWIIKSYESLSSIIENLNAKYFTSS